MNLEEEMRLRGLSNKDLAEKAGVSESTIRSWRRGSQMTKKNAAKIAQIMKNVPVLKNPPQMSEMRFKPLWSPAQRKAERRAKEALERRERLLASIRKRQADDEKCIETATFDLGPGREWQIAEANGLSIFWEPINAEEWKEKGKTKYCLVLAMYGLGFHASLIRYDEERNAYLPTDVDDGEGYLASQALDMLKRCARIKRIRITYKGEK